MLLGFLPSAFFTSQSGPHVPKEPGVFSLLSRFRSFFQSRCSHLTGQGISCLLADSHREFGSRPALSGYMPEEIWRKAGEFGWEVGRCFLLPLFSRALWPELEIIGILQEAAESFLLNFLKISSQPPPKRKNPSSFEELNSASFPRAASKVDIPS